MSFYPVSPDATPESVAMYVRIQQSSQLLTGQHDYLEDPNKYVQHIQDRTGHWPVVHGFELGGITGQSPQLLDSQRNQVIQAALAWGENGGIPLFTWHMPFPGSANEWSQVQRQTSHQEFEQVITSGTNLHASFIKELDHIALLFSKLQEKSISLVWRPFHEMNGGWFWWGKQRAFAALWDIMFKRFTKTHRLGNLLWMWCPHAPNAYTTEQPTDLPASYQIDMYGLDIYNGEFLQSHYDHIQSYAQGKPIAIGECDKLPSPESITATQPAWKWFMGWGKLVEEANSNETIQAVYAHPSTRHLQEWKAFSASHGLRGAYYRDLTFTDLAFSRVDPIIRFDWKQRSPHHSMGSDQFSVRWTGSLLPRYSEIYTFYVASDDGVRLWVDDQLIYDRWQNQSIQEGKGIIRLQANVWVPIKLEYFDNTGDARVYLRWSSPSQSKEIIPSMYLTPSKTSDPPGPDKPTYAEIKQQLQQLSLEIGNPEQLRTEQKNSLVDAINEIVQLLQALLEAGDRQQVMLNARTFGATPLEEQQGFDSTSALNEAIQASIKLGKPLYIPPGTYRLSSTLYANGKQVMIIGSGAATTKLIMDDSSKSDGILIGDDQPSGVRPSGYIKNLSIQGTKPRPTGFKAAVKINAMRHFEVKNVYVDHYDIGFDLIHNCYGSSFFMARTWAGVNVGVNLRTGVESGNDIQFYNCWFIGNIAAVHVSNDSGGFQFWGGQMSAGWYESQDDDLRGVITLGKDYISGRTGGVGNFSVEGVDIEGFKHCWAIRCYDTVKATFKGVGMQPNDPSHPAIGVLKNSHMNQSRINFERFQANGNYSSPALIVIDKAYSLASIQELNCGYGGSIQGKGVSGGSMLVQSKINIGQSLFREDWSNQLLLGNVWIREKEGKLERSLDWGASWQELTL
ncbi:glycosyl hydrolase [Marinicrinis sediminis]|uniref:Glycosyl hydrolase n=1 Tax=Marinicrinis sediminis TaxID=1652465 RepID=A0ABW5RCD7_9BACL